MDAGNAGPEISGQVESPGPNLVFVTRDDSPDHLDQIHTHKTVFAAAGLDAREVEYVVDQLGQPATFVMNNAVVLLGLLGGLGAAQLEGLRKEPNERQRRLQLVRNVRNEGLLYFS